jgi:antitoxin (DNA-binding transcriptional repressor) of toxin-antitoxin stability system
MRGGRWESASLSRAVVHRGPSIITGQAEICRKCPEWIVIYTGMASYDLEYARERLSELFQDARDGKEVIIVRDDGKSCELTPLAEVWSDEPSAMRASLPEEPEAPLTGDLVPA